MSLETLEQLETKVDNLIEAFKALKTESEALKQEMIEKDRIINELQTKNTGLDQEKDILRGDIEERQRKLDTAAERIQEILRKLEPMDQQANAQ